MNTQVTNTQLACIVAYGQTALANVPTLIHATSTLDISVAAKTHGDVTVHSYTTSSPYFVIPGYGTYQPGLAAIAHTRTLVFLRKHLGGPNFDLEKIWDEHTYFEFEVRSVAKTMATMVVGRTYCGLREAPCNNSPEARTIRQPYTNGMS